MGDRGYRYSWLVPPENLSRDIRNSCVWRVHNILVWVVIWIQNSTTNEKYCVSSDSHLPITPNVTNLVPWGDVRVLEFTQTGYQVWTIGCFGSSGWGPEAVDDFTVYFTFVHRNELFPVHTMWCTICFGSLICKD